MLVVCIVSKLVQIQAFSVWLAYLYHPTLECNSYTLGHEINSTSPTPPTSNSLSTFVRHYQTPKPVNMISHGEGSKKGWREGFDRGYSEGVTDGENQAKKKFQDAEYKAALIEEIKQHIWEVYEEPVKAEIRAQKEAEITAEVRKALRKEGFFKGYRLAESNAAMKKRTS